MKLYALKLKGTDKLLGFESSTNEGDFCVDITYELCEYSEKIWVVQSKEIAERVSKTTQKHYNADFQSPINKYIGQLEVVELTVEV